VTALQEFRDLFSAEVLAPEQEVAIRSIALLFSDVKASTSLYEAVGDASAYGRVNRHFAYLGEHVAARDGAVVKTIGDAVMAAFSSLDDAFAAAVEIQAGVDAWCRAQGIDPPLGLKLGLHRGPAIAVSANGQLDYFGRTVNIAARIAGAAGAGDVVMLAETFDELDGHELRGAVSAEPLRAELRGIAGTSELVRVRVRP
jgi:adenylate cyclase